MTAGSSVAPAVQPLPNTDRPHFGRYIVQQKIGAGGAAVVYRAYDLVAGRTVALKVLASAADSAGLQRFQREATTAGRLRHPHIVRTLQVGLGRGGTAAYIAMTLVEGESLAQLVGRVGRLSPAESCRLLAPIAQALAFAHRQGIVHRDVKPSNILLQTNAPHPEPAPADTASPASDPYRAAFARAESIAAQDITLDLLEYPVRPLLSDFGIARALDAPELTHVGRTVGTPAYMSPEQCAGNRKVDGRADIYALGAVLFRCIMGHPPFTGSTHQVLHAHVYSPLTIGEHTLATMSPALIDLLQCSLAKDPSDRFGNAAHMAARMDALAQGVTDVPDTAAASFPGLDATQTLEVTPVQNPSTAQVVLIASPPVTLAGTPAPAPGPPSPFSRRRFGRRHISMIALIVALTIILSGWQWLGTRGQHIALWFTPSPSAELLILEEDASALPLPTGPDDSHNSSAAGSPMTVPESIDAEESLPAPSPAGSFPAERSALSDPQQDPARPAVIEEDQPASEPEPTLPPAAVAQPAPTPPATPELPTSTPPPAMAAPDSTQPDAAGPTAAPEAEALAIACSSTVDEYFLDKLLPVEAVPTDFVCPVAPAQTPDGWMQRFQHGTLIYLRESGLVYIIYSPSGIWEQTAAEAIDDLALPLLPEVPSHIDANTVGIFAALSAAPHRQSVLGAPLDPYPHPVAFILQRFRSGILLGHPAEGEVFVLHREDLQL